MDERSLKEAMALLVASGSATHDTTTDTYHLTPKGIAEAEAVVVERGGDLEGFRRGINAGFELTIGRTVTPSNLRRRLARRFK